MKPYEKNARIITDQELIDLETWLDELGDLGGIVHDLNSDQIIGGNQRSRVFNINDCEIQIDQKKRKPDRQGTVAQGWVVWRGQRFAYRQVRWTEDQAAKANIIANKAGGAFDWNLLQVYNDPDDLLSWGFTQDELIAGGFDFPSNGSGDGSGDGVDHKTLVERFGVPPFSILDARQGYWQDRKRIWISLGIQSELGRGENALGLSDQTEEYRQDKKGYTGRANATPGGSAMPAAKLENGKTVRGDGRGRKLGQTYQAGGPDSLTHYKKMGPPETASLKGGLTLGTTIHPYDKTGEKRNSRRAADQRSNVTGAPKLPDWADNGTEYIASGTSIFDPVLCELVYRWFCPPLGQVLDPFAGGSVRGIVASYLAYPYIGIDLRPEQIAANEYQAEIIVPNQRPVWMEGDSRTILDGLDLQADLVFSCPPYYDLELYSDDERDLSNAGDYQTFLDGYREIVSKSVAKLKPNRFAVFVVGDIRDRKGFYRNFVSDTIGAFQDAGAMLYNEAILVTQVGSLSIRVSKQFGHYRKLGKTHQNVLVFYKGNPKAIKAEFGIVDVPDLAEQYGEIA